MANEIKKIRVDNIDYDVVDEITGYTSFSYVPASNLSNVVVGTMTFNGSTYTIYAPDQDITDTLDISVSGTNLIFDTTGSGIDPTADYLIPRQELPQVGNAQQTNISGTLNISADKASQVYSTSTLQGYIRVYQDGSQVFEEDITYYFPYCTITRGTFGAGDWQGVLIQLSNDQDEYLNIGYMNLSQGSTTCPVSGYIWTSGDETFEIELDLAS